MELKALVDGDERVLSNIALGVFDNDVRPELVSQYLREPRHHLIVAIDEDAVVGFASGVDYVHPDKPAELWLNEIAVAPSHRKQGIGRKLLKAMLERGRKLGCREAWVLTDEDNTQARSLYQAIGGTETSSVMVVFRL